MDKINISTMTPKQVLVKEAFTRLVPTDMMSIFGTENTIGTDDTLAYHYEDASKGIMTQADFLREHDVNAHKINSMKYWPNAIMKDKEGKVAAQSMGAKPKAQILGML